MVIRQIVGIRLPFTGKYPPQTSPIVWNLDYEWHDAEWMKKRKKVNELTSPISIYEIHLGSWKRKDR